ncbi:MAG: iron ABC transporter permease [Candidatus Hydrogenedentes bacterium]|nr:iron ABC transporter permease [Candidatus Hydrogenedentota bacterium]
MSLLFLVFAGVVVAPLVFLFASSVWVEGRIDLSAYSNVLHSSRQWGLLFRSVGLASGVSILATILGAGAAFSIQRLPRALQSPTTFALTLPVLVPQHIMAIAWVDVLGRTGHLSRFVQIAMPGAPPAPSPFTFWGTLFILTMTLFPVPMLATVAALGRFDARLLEAARVAGHARGAFRAIVLPLLMPSVLTGSMIVFALTISTFAVPSLLQVNTYPVEIHASCMSFDYGAAAAQSLPMIAVCAVGLMLWSAFVRPRHAWLSGASRSAPRIDARARTFPALFAISLALCALAVPLSALFVRSLPLRTYASVWETAHEEIVTGLIVATCTATIIALFAFMLAAVARHASARTFVRYASLVAFVVPGPLFALGMIALWNRPGVAGLVYDSTAILVLAGVARFFSFGEIVFEAQRSRVSPRVYESARIAGVPWWRVIGGVASPLALPYAIAVWIVTFVLALGEVDTTVLLSPPGVSTFALRLFSLMHYGPDSFVAALSLLTAIGVAVLAACGVAGFKMLSRRTHAGA